MSAANTMPGEARGLSLSNIKTKPKVLLGVAAPLLLTLLIAAVAVVNLNRMQTTQGWVDHTQAVLAEANRIVAAAVDMETGMRGFVIAGQDEFLDPYNAGSKAAGNVFAGLREMVSDNPPQVARLREAEDVLNDWRTLVAEKQIALRRAVGNSATMDDVVAQVAKAEGKAYFDRFRALMSDFSEREAALMTVRRADNDRTRLMTEVMILGAVALAVILGGLVAWAVGSNIGGAVERLTKAMGRLSDGDNSVEVPDQSRGDEVGAMARATEVFKQNAIRIAKLNEERAADAARMAELAAEREKATKREMELAQEKEKTDRAAAAERDAMMRRLDEAFGNVVETAIDGEFSHRVDAAFGDEVLNRLALNINRLLGTIDDGLARTGRALGRVAGGDLSERMHGDFRGAFARLQSDVNEMIDSLTSLVNEITTRSGSFASSSSELSTTATALSRQAERNAASLEETSAALDEVSSNITRISGNVEDASRNAREARSTAQSSQEVSSKAASSMDRIADASQQIAKVVNVIDDISFQINLLALNAGVEAARAGDAGRGFSVVASEVRALAQRSGEAASEIRAVIASSDEAVSQGVTNVSAAKSSLEAIAESVVKIAASVDEVATAISEQSSGIGEISSAVNAIDRNSQKQTAAFEEITAATGVLADEAEGLRQSIARFSTGGQTVVAMQRRA